MSASVHSFSYAAIDASGTERRGYIEAASDDDARERIRRDGALLLDLRRSALRAPLRTRLALDELSVGFRVLADLADAGLTVGRALNVFEGLAPPGWRNGITSVQVAVREGQSLSSGLRRARLGIPPLLIGVVLAGEAGDGLAAGLRRAAEHAERASATRRALRSALAYPAIVAVAGVASLGVMLGVVLPRFTALLLDLGQDLPRSTERLLAIASVARVALPVALVAAVLCAACLHLMGLSETWSRRRGRALLKIPVVGAIRRSLLDARVGTSLGALLDSGVPLRRALQLAADAVADAEIRTRLLASAESVGHGDSLSKALARTEAVSAATVRVVRAGEQTGKVGAMCDRAARLADAHASQTISTAVRLLEPALILCFAAVVGFVAVALLQAVYAIRPV